MTNPAVYATCVTSVYLIKNICYFLSISCNKWETVFVKKKLHAHIAKKKLQRCRAKNVIFVVKSSVAQFVGFQDFTSAVNFTEKQ